MATRVGLLPSVLGDSVAEGTATIRDAILSKDEREFDERLRTEAAAQVADKHEADMNDAHFNALTSTLTLGNSLVQGGATVKAGQLFASQLENPFVRPFLEGLAISQGKDNILDVDIGEDTLKAFGDRELLEQTKASLATGDRVLFDQLFRGTSRTPQELAETERLDAAAADLDRTVQNHENIALLAASPEEQEARLFAKWQIARNQNGDVRSQAQFAVEQQMRIRREELAASIRDGDLNRLEARARDDAEYFQQTLDITATQLVPVIKAMGENPENAIDAVVGFSRRTGDMNSALGVYMGGALVPTAVDYALASADTTLMDETANKLFESAMNIMKEEDPDEEMVQMLLGGMARIAEERGGVFFGLDPESGEMKLGIADNPQTEALNEAEAGQVDLASELPEIEAMLRANWITEQEVRDSFKNGEQALAMIESQNEGFLASVSGNDGTGADDTGAGDQLGDTFDSEGFLGDMLGVLSSGDNQEDLRVDREVGGFSATMGAPDAPAGAEQILTLRDIVTAQGMNRADTRAAIIERTTLSEEGDSTLVDGLLNLIRAEQADLNLIDQTPDMSDTRLEKIRGDQQRRAVRIDEMLADAQARIARRRRSRERRSGGN